MELATLIFALVACLLGLAGLLKRPKPGLSGEDLEKVRQDLLADRKSVV